MANRYLQHPSPTGHFVDGHLVPLPEAVAADSVVWFALPRDDGPDQQWEGLAAERATPASETVRLVAVPLFAYDLHYGDEVSVVPSNEGPLVATRKVRDSGNHTFRVWLDADIRTTVPAVVDEFARLGCFVEGYSERLLGLSCGPTQVDAVESALKRAEDDHRFVYERGRT